MSRYHPSTHLTDRNLTPNGVFKLSSGDCRHLMNSKATTAQQQLITSIDAAPYCKVTWGTTISRRLEHISEILNIHPQLLNDEGHQIIPKYMQQHHMKRHMQLQYQIKSMQMLRMMQRYSWHLEDHVYMYYQSIKIKRKIYYPDQIQLVKDYQKIYKPS